MRAFYVLVVALGIPLLVISALPAWGASAPEAPAAAQDTLMTRGMHACHRGVFEDAAQLWQEVAARYAQAKQAQAQAQALTHLAQAYQALGHYGKARVSLEAAQILAEQFDDRTQLAAVLGSLGNVYIATGPPGRAESLLRQARALAKQVDHTGLAASIINNLGNLLTAQARPQKALAAYQESMRLAHQADRPALAVRAQINAATAAVQAARYQEAEALLHPAWQQMQQFAPTHQKAYNCNKIGLAHEALHPHLSQRNDALLLRAAAAFNTAARVAQALDDARAMSYAWGYLGRLYERKHRYREALQLTRRAVTAAQRVRAPESLYRWQWQAGRLLTAQGHTEAALAAYRRAITTFQSIRPELSASYGKPPAVFRASTGRLYFEFVDLLLRQAAAMPPQTAAAPYLHEARETVERFKAAELRDYFRDDCVDAAHLSPTPLDRFAKTAVIVYPILLPDRTELLVSLPQGLKRYEVRVTASKLQRVVRRFRKALRQDNRQRYMRHAQRLYNWLVRPLEADLAATDIRTLVFVPDGALRLLPMAALHDGERFLVQTYALATTPSLNLTDPQPLNRDRIRTLTLGLTKSRQGFSALPYVRDEVMAIRELYGGTQLLNENFLVDTMEQQLKTGDYSIVHIASHGEFASDVAQSFVLTFDDKLTMDRLEALIGRLRYRQDPLELLTLSACETAVGDDRAALGLAGIAIKAGARSALATLWRVEDQATAVLVTEFYRQLREPATSRAQALQRAQIRLLGDPLYQSPFFWSPFLLINNWF